MTVTIACHMLLRIPLSWPHTIDCCKVKYCGSAYDWMGKRTRAFFCPMHMCRDEDCENEVDTLRL